MGRSGQPWSDEEIETALEAYFAMLVWEREGHSFVKADVLAELSSRLPARSDSSIEMKWSNISAVLDEMDFPWVSGLKPLANYQQKLRGAVDQWLKRNPDALE
jgi:hypothetical protein